MKKSTNKILECFKTSGIMLVFSLVLLVFGLVFMLEGIPIAVTVIFGFVFMFLQFFITFGLGRGRGEADYKKATNMKKDGRSAFTVDKINIFAPVYYFLPYFIFVLIFLILGISLNNAVLHAVVLLLFLPASLVFQTLGVITTDPVTWTSFAVYFPYLVLFCGFFIFGYFYKILSLRKVHRDIESELRMFNG